MSRKKGYVGQRKRDGRWFARITIAGKDHIKFGQDKQDAEWLLRCMQLGLDTPRSDVSQAVRGKVATVTVAEILRRFSEVKVTEPVYRGDRKVSGLRSHRTVALRIEVLREALGDIPINHLTPSRIEQFRLQRLNTPTQYGRERSIADVNRCLEQLRTVLLWAEGECLIERAPVVKLEKAHETKRERILTDAEEVKLLAACDTPKRRQLKPLIIFALETGARANEIRQVRWLDVNTSARTITLRALTTKTAKMRRIPLSERLNKVLRDLVLSLRSDTMLDTDRIFQMTTWQKSWDAACKAAKIVGLRFHDLRATFASRLIARGIPVELVAKITGHSTPQILYANYIRTDKAALDAIRDALNRKG